MKTLIRIHDTRSAVELEIDGRAIRVLDDSGCPLIENILNGLNIGRSIEQVAHRILHRWLTGYKGDPVANQLSVDVIRGDDRTTATI